MHVNQLDFYTKDLVPNRSSKFFIGDLESACLEAGKQVGLQTKAVIHTVIVL